MYYYAPLEKIVVIERKTVCIVALSAALICVLVYLRTLSCDFIHVDDHDFVLDNNVIRNLDSGLLAWAFTTTYTGLWIPLTWVSLAIDYHFWGLNPAGYHLSNILLHSANVGIVVLIADRILQGTGPCGVLFGGNGSRQATNRYLYPAILLLAGLLWGIHPLRVESVAWVSERKDVLNGFLTLGSVFFYLKYFQDRKAERITVARIDYVLSFLLFLLSLFAKQVSVVLPAVLIVLDWHPLGRLYKGNLKPVLLEKLPYLLISAVVSYVTIKSGASNDIMVPLDMLSGGLRLIISGNALMEYYRLMIFPVGISPFYKLPYPIPYVYGIKAFAVAVITVGIFYRYRSKPALFAVWLIFMLPLLPVIGVLQNGDQAFAARYTYLPGVSISIAAAILAGRAYEKAFPLQDRFCQRAIMVASAGLLVFYSVMAFRLIGDWKDTGTYWSRVIAIDPASLPGAYLKRGGFYHATGRYEAAVSDFSALIDAEIKEGVSPNFNYFGLRGDALAKLGRHDEAARDFSTAISIYPHPAYYHARATALKNMGRHLEAEADLNLAGSVVEPIDWFQAPTEPVKQ